MASSPTFLASGGEMGRRMREFDWSQHPLGLPENWPHSLQVVIRLMLNSRFSMWMGWGPEFYFFCNDAYAPTLGIKLDWVLGESARKVWEEIWDDIGPRAESVVRTGEATWDESLPLFLERSGFPEETYHTFSYSPVPRDDGAIGGMLCVVTEETERLIGERRLNLLRDLGADLTSIKSEAELFRALPTRLAKDLPFALVYLLSADEKSVQLACAHPTEAGRALAPEAILLNGKDETWPATRLLAKHSPVLVSELGNQFANLPSEPWDKAPREALLVPIAQQGQQKPAGFLVAGLNPYRPLDAAYRGFLDLFAGQIAAGLASARAYETERKRAEALAEIDRAKTAFFSNVSHEFRTPLTLLLGPLEEMATQADADWLREGRGLIDLARRNGLRLLKLVNTLLDFSRIEAGRVRARFEPTDLAAYTAELASSFRSAMQKAGLAFVVECPPLAEPVYLDREMWEKIVLNLLSNAFKFTLAGEVRVQVAALEEAVELRVSDTGAGIPEEAIPRLFERFYRVQGTTGRTHEGSGIGLALVHELAKLHGGTVRVESTADVGSTFFVAIPLGFAHLPKEQCAAASATIREGNAATAFVAEALRWLPDADEPPAAAAEVTDSDLPVSTGSRPRILLADDNADMRDYVARLLSPRFEVIAVADGRSALDAALAERPDLVLTDVMMPRLDGFGLLREMRADAALQTVPIILLSARAGEEARVEGLEAGADDYLTKPFHARELLARVESTLTLARVRAEAQLRETELRAERTEILESMNLAFMAMDADFRILYLNIEASRIYNMTPEKHLGISHWEAFPESRGTPIESYYRRAMTERIPLHFENYYEPWQQWFEINIYPTTSGGLGVFFRDITESKNAEDALRQSEQRHRLMAETMLQGVVHQGADGQIIAINPAAERILGKTREQLLGSTSEREEHHTIREDGSPFPGEEHPSSVALKTGTNVGGVLMGIFNPQRQEYRWISIDAVPVIIPGSTQPSEVYTIFEDITEQRLAENALQEAKAAAEAANSSKDRFIAVLSHELRTPLTPVLMAIGAWENDPALSAGLRADLVMMRRNIELETKLIDDLLDLNRIASRKLLLQLEPLDLNELVRQVGGICRQALDERSIHLEMTLDSGAGLVNADRARLQQVLWNVLKNAIKFTPKAGVIRVATRRLAGQRCQVRVEDTGIGIPEEVLPRIFNAFEQGDARVTRQFGGMGLGLAISKALVDLHRGSISAESPGSGRGATFIVDLPGAVAGDVSARTTIAPAVETKTRPLRLLLVEDHSDTSQVLARLLRRQGFEVIVAADVASATARAESEAFDVLVSDLGLPDGTGCDVIRRMHARQNVPGIAMSGYGMEDDVRRSREAGFFEHLVKPIDLPQLIAAIHRATHDA